MDVRSLVSSHALLAVAVVAMSGCSGTMEEPEKENSADREIVKPGKADNYFSTVSKEFEMEGTIPVEMSEEEYQDEEKRKQKIDERTTAVGLYLTAYMTEKLDDLFDNTDYGGFQSMVRNRSAETEDITKTGEGTYEVTFTIDVAGPDDLAERMLEADAERADGGVQFDLEIPEGASTDPENASPSTPRDYDPDEYDGELETVTLTARPLPTLGDSYPHYASFTEDGVYDITVVIGHDYNDKRWDLITAEEIYDRLVRLGFEQPAPSYEDLSASSGPFTKTVQGDGETGEFEVQVRVFHSDMFEDRREEHRQTVVEELRKRDVFYYWGHAGPYFGFSLGPNDKADISPHELSELDLSSKEQLVIASGCQTYSQYADVLYANDDKSESNLDVITTVNYSNLAAGDALLEPLLETENGQHEPTSFYDLVEAVNSPFATRRMDTFYGVIGIDGNPQVHPYGNVDALGESCRTDTDCGAHAGGNVCVEGTCTVRTLAKGSCPSGAEFGYLSEGGQSQGGVCYK